MGLGFALLSVPKRSGPDAGITGGYLLRKYLGTYVYYFLGRPNKSKMPGPDVGKTEENNMTVTVHFQHSFRPSAYYYYYYYY